MNANVNIHNGKNKGICDSAYAHMQFQECPRVIIERVSDRFDNIIVYTIEVVLCYIMAPFPFTLYKKSYFFNMNESLYEHAKRWFGKIAF